MREYLSMKPNERLEIMEKIKQTLSKEEEVVFAFIFGSFLSSPSFRDIDVGVYVKRIEKEATFDYELGLSQKIANSCNLPFDVIEVKVLNFTPSSFLGNIFNSGRLLLCKNERQLSEMIESCSLDAIANEYISRQSLKELLPS